MPAVTARRGRAAREGVVEVEALAKDFGSFRAIDGITFTVRGGESLVILGENGAGKTTTLRCLAGVLSPSAGTVRLGGVSVADDAEAVRSQVGLLSEVPGLYERMTAPDYLDFFGRIQGMAADVRAERIPELLSLFGLAERSDVWMGSFSKGMRQKVALIRATLHHPRVLLLDEPTSSMDPAGARLTWDYILALKESGIAVVVCTHNLRETRGWPTGLPSWRAAGCWPRAGSRSCSGILVSSRATCGRWCRASRTSTWR